MVVPERNAVTVLEWLGRVRAPWHSLRFDIPTDLSNHIGQCPKLSSVYSASRIGFVVRASMADVDEWPGGIGSGCLCSPQADDSRLVQRRTVYVGRWIGRITLPAPRWTGRTRRLSFRTFAVPRIGRDILHRKPGERGAGSCLPRADVCMGILVANCGWLASLRLHL